MRNEFIEKFDLKILGLLKKYHLLFARLAIFIVYFWFGLLKLLNLSPASELVQSLLQKTLPFISFQNFLVLFALFEMLIGLLFLIRGLERLAVALLALHLIATILPLILLPQLTWQAWFAPTLEGQYIIKNVLIAALAFVIISQKNFLHSK